MPVFHIPGIGFHLFCTKVLSDFGGARLYFQTVTAAIVDMQQKETSSLAQKASDANWSNEKFSMHSAEIGGKYGLHIPRVLTYSFITYLHSIVESKLEMIANELYKSKKLPIRLKDIIGTPIDRAALYLDKFGQLNIRDDSGWAILRDLQKIRNIIVHRAGTIGAEKKEHDNIYQIAKRHHAGLTASYGWNHPDSYLSLTSDVCIFFLDAAVAFFERILAAIRPAIAVDHSHGAV